MIAFQFRGTWDASRTGNPEPSLVSSWLLSPLNAFLSGEQDPKASEERLDASDRHSRCQRRAGQVQRLHGSDPNDVALAWDGLAGEDQGRVHPIAPWQIVFSLEGTSYRQA
jgi:hypothetical protein